MENGRTNLEKALLWGIGLVGGSTLGLLGLRKMGGALSRYFGKVIMTDLYDENLWELVSSSSRAGLQSIVEISLRSKDGKVIRRPFGSPYPRPGLEDIMFDIAQLYRMPTPHDAPIDMTVTLGKKAAKPLTLQTPIMISGMAYGEALSEKAKLALAMGAAQAGAAYNTGEGPFLPDERRRTKHLILQYSRGTWSKSPDILRQADMIEIQLGQGASAGVGHVIKSSQIDRKLRRQLNLAAGTNAVIQSRQPEVQSPEQLKPLIDRLRAITGGVPIGVKIGAGKFLEEDLNWIIASGADVVAIDGSVAATKGTLPILEDDFGLPTLFALIRAVQWLDKEGVRDRVSLIVGGGLFTPGAFLKAIALGADAVYTGTAISFALTHTQVLNALPWEPPTQAIWYGGKYASKFDTAIGAKHVANFLNSCTEEMKDGVRALGKHSLAEVDREDLFATNEFTAKATGLPLGSVPSGETASGGSVPVQNPLQL